MLLKPPTSIEEQEDVQEPKKNTTSTTRTPIATAPLCAPTKEVTARAIFPTSPAVSLAVVPAFWAVLPASRAALAYCRLIRCFCWNRERGELFSSGWSCKER